MITIKNVKTLDGLTTDITLSSSKTHVIDAERKLTLFPGLIDPHVICGSPEQDNWRFTIESAVRGGITTLLDIPSHDFPSEKKKEMEQKKLLIKKRLADLKIPVRFFLYGKGNAKNVNEIGAEKSLIVGSLILLTPEDHLLDKRSWNRIFQLAAWEDFPVVINSRNENSIKDPRFLDAGETLLEKALYYTEKQNARLYVLNVSTQKEIDLIQEARRRSLLIYAETTPEHLFPKSGKDSYFLWEALNKGIIETIGSGYHAEAQSQERLIFDGKNFAFLNPNFLLPLLLTGYHQGKIGLENIVRSTRINLYDIFKIERKDEDAVLVDLEEEKVVQRVDKDQTSEMKIKGWPVYTIVKGEIFTIDKSGYHLSPVE